MNTFKNSIYAQMWKENPQFRKDIKTALAVFGFGILLFTYGSIKGCCVDKKAEKAQQETKTVTVPESLQNNSIINYQTQNQR